MKTKAYALLVALLSAASVHAGTFLVMNATITSVYSTNDNTPAFAIAVAGGSGPCANSTNIAFPQSAAPDADTLKRAYATALLAFSTGAHISIYNYFDATCTNASYIAIYN